MPTSTPGPQQLAEILQLIASFNLLHQHKRYSSKWLTRREARACHGVHAHHWPARPHHHAWARTHHACRTDAQAVDNHRQQAGAGLLTAGCVAEHTRCVTHTKHCAGALPHALSLRFKLSRAVRMCHEHAGWRVTEEPAGISYLQASSCQVACRRGRQGRAYQACRACQAYRQGPCRARAQHHGAARRHHCQRHLQQVHVRQGRHRALLKQTHLQGWH